MTTRDFADGDTANWIAVLPVAAIEQHGPHLPVATDAAIAEGMLARAVELMPDDLPVTFLPVQAIGKSNEHISSPGTLTSTWDTTTRLWLDIGDSVHRAGVGKLIVINSHGGNVPMIDIVARELRVRHDMLVVATAWSRFGHPEGVLTPREALYGIHGGDIETSIMLHLRPDLVDMDKAKDFRSAQLDFIEEFKHLRAHGPVQFGWKAQDLGPDGTVGNAAAATAEKGKAVVDHQAAAFVELCRDVHAFDLARLWKP
jgi:creatinine amidohydrolase